MTGAGLEAPPSTIPPKYSCTNYFVQLVPFLYLACTGSGRFCPAHPHVQLFFRFASATLGQERNMERFFQYFRDDRFALTTLRNPNLEVRTYAQLVQAAQQEREWQARAAQYAAPQPHATPATPDSIPSTAFPENVASTAPDPYPTALAPLDSAHPDSASPDSINPDSPSPGSSNEAAQQILDSLVADVIAAGSSLPSSSSDDKELTAPPTPKPRRKAQSKSRRKSNRGTCLPAAQPALPAHTNVLSAAACLPDRQASEEILIASPPNIKKRCNPLKTILSHSS